MARVVVVSRATLDTEVIAVFGVEHCEPRGNGLMQFSRAGWDQMERLGVTWRYERHYDNGVGLIIPKDKQLEVQIGFADVVIQDF